MTTNSEQGKTMSDSPQIDRRRGRTRRKSPVLSGVVLACGAALLIAACGGSSSSTPASSSSTPSANATAGTSGAPQTTANGKKAKGSKSSDHAATHSQPVVKSHDVVTHGNPIHRPVHGTGGASHNDDNPGLADTGGPQRHKGQPIAGQVDPCTLVSQSEARSIVGGPMEVPLEAPLGPTCIYQASGHKRSITLAVESINFSQVKRHITHTKQVVVQGRSAYCGNYGQPTTFVPLSGNQVLTVTAPCSEGKLFAARALPRLKA